MIPDDTTFGPYGVVSCSPASNLRVRDFSDEVDVTLLTDEQLNERIAMCSIQLYAAHELGMKDERKRWWDEEARCLRERNRRPHLVEARERELGLLKDGEGTFA